MAEKKKRIWLRVLVTIIAALLFLVAALGVTFGIVWGNEISTVSSFTLLRDRNDANKEGALYRMNVKGGYYFDKFLAQGGAKTDAELIAFITNNITRGLMDMTIKQSDIGCSSFTATLANGDKIFARNYDFDKTNVCLTFTNPGGGRHKSFASVDLNYVGMDVNSNVEGLMNKITCLAAPFAPLDGINDAGVSCGIYMTYQGEVADNNAVATNQKDPNKGDITSTTMLRMVLDYASDVDEAVELIKSYNLHDSANTSFHYMVADASGRSAILEWIPLQDDPEHPYGTDATDNDGSARELVVVYNDDDAYIGKAEGNCNFQWITNFIIQPGYYANDAEKAGLDRYNQIHDDLAATDGILADEWAAMDILKTVGRRSWAGGGGCTVHSVVYNLTKKTALWVSNENFSDETAVFEYSLTTGKLVNGRRA